jgi:hypothetical protein
MQGDLLVFGRLAAAAVEGADQRGAEEREPVFDAHVLDEQAVAGFFRAGADPAGEFLPELAVRPLNPVSLRHEIRHSLALGLAIDNAEPGAFQIGGVDQGVEQRVRQRVRHKRLAIGPALGDGVEHEDVFGSGVASKPEMEPGQEIGLLRVRADLGAIFMAEILGSDAEIEEGGATTDGQLALLRIDGGQGAAPIGEQLDVHGVNAEHPGLRIVARGRENGVSDEELELVGGETVGGEGVG